MGAPAGQYGVALSRPTQQAPTIKTMTPSRLIALLASAAGFGGAALLWRKSEETKQATVAAIAGGGTFNARLTGYWPYAARTATEIKMEGGHNDRKGKPIHTLEQHRADPVAHPYVSVSGDDAIFPYGQRIKIDRWPDAVFRVVDTGGHFRGSNKVYRISGAEPLDVAVDSPKTKVTPGAVVAIIKGDHFDKPGKEIAAGRFSGQIVSVGGGLDCLGAIAA